MSIGVKTFKGNSTLETFLAEKEIITIFTHPTML